MTTEISNADDLIDVRDIIARVEEIEDTLQAAMDANAEGHNFDDLGVYIAAVIQDASAAHAHPLWDEATEHRDLCALLESLKGMGGDEQWRGDWYPVSLIRESYFEEAMDELLEDIGDLPRDLPGYLTITVNYDALKMDYSSVEFNDVTYWTR